MVALKINAAAVEAVIACWTSRIAKDTEDWATANIAGATITTKIAAIKDWATTNAIVYDGVRCAAAVVAERKATVRLARTLAAVGAVDEQNGKDSV